MKRKPTSSRKKPSSFASIQEELLLDEIMMFDPQPLTKKQETEKKHPNKKHGMSKKMNVIK